MKLYSYFRSSAAYRVRIALNIKGINYETVPVHLLKDGGQQLSESYRALNPTALVPTLAEGDWSVGQSMAILEYLEETHPTPALLPSEPQARARVRAIAQTIACDIHPLNNLRVLKYLKHQIGVDEKTKNQWYAHWTEEGLASVEALLSRSSETGRYCHGDQITFADICLIPQVVNAKRFECNLDDMPTIQRIYKACVDLDAFQKAAPLNQPDNQA